MTLLDRVKTLCKKHGISQGKLEKEIGISNGASYKWKNSSPSMEVLQRLAAYFNVSVDYLMTGEEARIPAPVFEEDHIKLIAMYSKLNKEQKEAVFNLLRSFCSE